MVQFGDRKLSTMSVAITCTLFVSVVISGAIFGTYLLNKLDVLEQEVRIQLILVLFYIGISIRM